MVVDKDVFVAELRSVATALSVAVPAVDPDVEEAFGKDIGWAVAVEKAWRDINPRALKRLIGANHLEPATRWRGRPMRWPRHCVMLRDEMGDLHRVNCRALWQVKRRCGKLNFADVAVRL